jgi:hypothetical protein
VIAHEDSSDPANQRLLQSVTGIVFLGTPHRGSGTANLGNLVGTMVNTFLKAASAGLQTKTIRTDLLRHLESDSKALQELTDSVRNRLGGIQIVSFYETEPESLWSSVSHIDVSPGPSCQTRPNHSRLLTLRQVVVDKISATLRIPTERIYPLYASHRDLCRFHSQNSEYRTVVSEIRRVAQAAPRLPNRASTHSSLTSESPLSGC